MSEMKYVMLSDQVLSATIGDVIDIELNKRIIETVKILKSFAIKGIEAVQHTYHQIAVYFDSDVICPEAIKQHLDVAYERARETQYRSVQTSKIVEIKVKYDGEDLKNVAEHHQLSCEEVIQRHSEAVYHTYFLGFSAGFPYLAGVNPSIATPRRSEPRIRVTAGSVGIAESQTGIYTVDSPGGWQIIGHTVDVVFDATRDVPCMIEPGDLVKFISV